MTTTPPRPSTPTPTRAETATETTTPVADDLDQLLRGLGLPKIRAILGRELAYAEAQGPSYSDFLRPEQSNIFFKLMEERYSRRVSTIVTTNLGYDAWYEFLGNKEMVAALLDRLRHRCTTLEITGPSLRRAGDGG